MHCALLHTQTAKHHGCNEFVHCCMPRPQSIPFHIASMANTQMSLSHSRYLQCYLKIRYIHGALRVLGMQHYAMHNATIQKDNLFWIRCINITLKGYVRQRLAFKPKIVVQSNVVSITYATSQVIHNVKLHCSFTILRPVLQFISET